MVLCKLPVPGLPTYSDQSRARVNCACSRCGGRVLFGICFLSPIIIQFLSLFLCETIRYRPKYCVKGP